MPDVTMTATDSSGIPQADIFAALAEENSQPSECPKHLGAAITTTMFRRGYAKLVFFCGCVWDTETRSLRSHDD